MKKGSVHSFNVFSTLIFESQNRRLLSSIAFFSLKPTSFSRRLQTSYCKVVRAMLFDAPISVDGPTALDDEAVSGGDSEPVTLKSRKFFFLK